MSQDNHTLLLIASDQEDYAYLASQIDDGTFSWRFHWLQPGAEVVTSLLSETYDLCLFVVGSGERDLLQRLGEFGANHLAGALIVVADTFDEKLASLARQIQAADFLLRSELTPPLLQRVIRHALEQAQWRQRYEQIIATHHRVLAETDQINNQRAVQASLRADISAVLTGKGSLPEILQQCAEAIVLDLGIAFARIWTLDNETNTLILRASAGIYSQNDGPHGRIPMGHLKIGRIAQERRPQFTNDISRYPDTDQKWVVAAGLVAFAGYPLLVEGQVIGVLALFSRRPLPDDTPETISIIADIIAHGIARKKVEENLAEIRDELAEQNARLTALYRVGQIINSTLEPDVILERLVDEAMYVSHATHAQVLVVQKESARFERRFLRGFSEAEAELAWAAPLPLNKGLNGDVYRTKQAMLVADVQALEHYYPLLPTTRSEMVVPIIRDGEVLGNLDLQSPEPDAFREGDLTYLNSLVDQVAVALTNARVFHTVQQAEQEWQATFNAMQDAVVMIDHEGIVIRANQAFHQIVGLTAATLPGSSYHLLLQHLRCPERTCPLDQTLSGGVAARCTHYQGDRILDVYTLPFWERSASRPDQIRRMIYVLQDVTERRRAEEGLMALTAQLEQSNRELQDFASVASHDLQEPLRKIQAFGNRLKRKDGAALSEEGLDSLQRMQSAAGRMQALINDLLLYSRITTQAQPFVAIDLNAIVADVLADLEVRIEQAHGRVEVAELPVIEADSVQMRQLFQNLISNALKFARPEVPPLVTVYAHHLPAAQTNNQPARTNDLVQFVVEDNGIGFAEKYVDRIFIPFQRLHNRTVYEGTGMGLAICRKIVDRHRGRIDVQSRPGEGTRFIITLPLVENQNGAVLKSAPVST
jgi:PAS domain S-box-containing protein